MILKLSSLDKKKIEALLEVKSINMNLADMLLYAFDDINAIQPCKSKDDFIANLSSFWRIDLNNKENKEIINRYILKELKIIEEKDISSNPYFKNIKVPEIKDGFYRLGYQYHLAYQPFAYDDIKVDENDYAEIQSVGYSINDIKYPILTYKDIVWMSINPNEIKTMETAIDNAYGHVLVLGLGLGYFPYMIVNKENIKSITIIEKDEHIINLFKKYLLNQFPHQEKIKIIKDDAFKYLKNNLNQFDYLYADLWHSPIDGLPMYLKIQKLSRSFKGQKFFWLENSILAMLRRCLLTIIEEQLEGSKESDYLKAKDDYDKIINVLYFKTKNVVINSYEQIIKMLRDDNLKHLY